MNTHAGVQVFGIPTDHQFTSQDDLIAIFFDSLSPANTLHNGDIIVITSKVVAKCEGRVVTEVQDRESAIRSETKRVVAKKVHDRGVTTIVETHTGLILAAAGVDASNTEPGTIVLLPVDSDHSARRIREQIEERAGVSIGVIITDTLGRAWRLGVSDHAIGAAGVTVLEAGSVVTEGDIWGKRPGTGVPSFKIAEFHGRSLTRSVSENTLLSESDFS